jgi:hypothetical protein
MVDYTSAMNSTGVLAVLSKHKTAQVQRKMNDNRIGICRRGREQVLLHPAYYSKPEIHECC